MYMYMCDLRDIKLCMHKRMYVLLDHAQAWSDYLRQQCYVPCTPVIAPLPR